jgi:CMP-N,N'-diacetyllegionaminic acid synthase
VFNGKKILAIIPARGGSKRLPKKNILELAGKPLIAWTIEAALDSKLIDEVMVSTDDKIIAEISKEYGAIVPFLRSEELSGDNSDSMNVIFDVLDKYIDRGQEYDYVLLLQPTSPLRTSTHIIEAILQLNDKQADCVVSACPCEHSPLWANVIPENGSMNGFIRPDIIGKRSQDLPQYSRLNGAIYLAKVEKLFKHRDFLSEDMTVYAYKMESSSSVDIDTLLDFQLAEMILKQKKQESTND